MRPDPAMGLPSNETLFAPGAPVRDEAKRMLAWVHAVLEGDDPDLALRFCWYAVRPQGEVRDAVVRAVIDSIRAGELPPAALEVLAALSALITPKDYQMRPYWSAAWALAEPLPEGASPGEPQLLSRGDLGRIEALTHLLGPSAASAYRAHLEEVAREGSVRDDLGRSRREGIATQLSSRYPDQSDDIRAIIEEQRLAAEVLGYEDPRRAGEGERAPSGEILATAARVAPLGAGGSWRSRLFEARPVLWQNRGRGVAWEALCMGFDAVAASSFVGLERLRALAREHPESPSIAWLEEVACRVAREDEARAGERAARLDAMIEGGSLGRHAAKVLTGVQMGREWLDKEGVKAHDAWLRLGASRALIGPSLAQMEEEAGTELSPATRAALRRAAQQGNSGAQLIQAVDAVLGAMMARERVDMVNLGPFFELHNEPEGTESLFNALAHYTVIGFRKTYALELLREAIPRLRGALS